jgi:ribonuclease P protein component
MLPKNKRISRKEFGELLTNGKRFNSPHLLLYILQNKEADSRFAFSVSKKVAKSAVERNKYRRRGYSIISKNSTKIKKGFYFFFSFKKNSIPIAFTNLEKEVGELLSSASMLS